MNYTILSAKKYNLKLKCTIQATGKLGFTDATSKYMKLSEFSHVKFAQDNEDKETLYLIHINEVNEDAFKVVKAGKYFYVNTKALFDTLEYDYKNNTIIFDMVEQKEEGIEIYKLLKREMPRKRKQ
jgi:hypothetical protein